METKPLIDLEDFSFDESELDFDIESDSELTREFSKLSNPYMDWADGNKHFLAKNATINQLIFSFFIKYTDYENMDYEECSSLCVFYLTKSLNRDLQLVIQRELIQKELDSFLKDKKVIGKIRSAEEIKLNLDRQLKLLKERFDLSFLNQSAFDWMRSKHPDVYNLLDNPTCNNREYYRMLRKCIRWDLKQNDRGLLKDSLLAALEEQYIRLFNTFREYSVQKNRLTLLNPNATTHLPLRVSECSPVGARKSDFNRVTTNAMGSTVTSTRVKLSLNACAKPMMYQSENSVSDLPYDDPLRKSGLIKVLKKRKILG